jgi:Tfp pilus assembly protein FimT
MNSLKTSTHNSEAGFSFIEVMIVTAIMLFFVGVGIFLSADVYRSSLFRADADTVVSALQRARTRSVNNINEAPHGVRITTSGYTIFEGADYNSRVVARDEIIAIGSGYTISTSPTINPIDIIFTQLSGESNFNGDISITGSGTTTTVSVNSEGRIDF